jgi:hypothetical protein
MDTLKHLKEAYQEVPRDLKKMAKDFLFSAWHTLPKVAPSLAAIGMNQLTLRQCWATLRKHYALPLSVCSKGQAAQLRK